MIDVRGESQLPAAGGDDEAGESFAIEHQFAIQLVFRAEGAGFCEDVACAGIVDLNFGERAVFAENGKRFEENGEVGARTPISHVVSDEVRAKEIGPIAAFTVALRSAGEVEFGFFKKRALNFEASVNGIGKIFRDKHAEKIRSHAGVKILAHFECDFDFFGEGQGNMLGHLVVGNVEASERFEVWRGGF